MPTCRDDDDDEVKPFFVSSDLKYNNPVYDWDPQDPGQQ